MDFLILIKNGCDNLTATASPSVDALGLRMVLSLATIMLVWFGVQEALASAQGGPGFNVGKFLSFFLLITFAYCFVKFYDGSIPGIGYSLKGFISGGTSSLVDYIGSDSTQEVQNTIHTALSKVGSDVAVVHRTIHVALHIDSSDHPQHSDGTDWRHHRLRSNRSHDHRPARSGLHPVDGLRQDRLPLLGLAQGLSRFRVLQGRGRRNHERDEPPAHHLSHQRSDEC